LRSGKPVAPRGHGRASMKGLQQSRNPLTYNL